MSTDLSDLSIILPFRKDSQDRENNLNVILNYFNKYFSNVEIIVIENSSKRELFLSDSINYRYEFNNNFFHRTKLLNDGAKLSIRPYISCYDTDVIFHPDAIHKTMELLRNGKEFVFSYNGMFIGFRKPHNIFTKNFLFETIPYKYCQNHSPNSIQATNPQCYLVIPEKSVGGATFFNRKTFLNLGGYNHHFKSWGWEDVEIVHRFKKYGIAFERVEDYNLIHLDHDRGSDSRHNSFTYSNEQEYKRIMNMNDSQYFEYVKTL